MITVGGNQEQLSSGVKANIAANAALNTITVARNSNQHSGYSRAPHYEEDYFEAGEDFTF